MKKMIILTDKEVSVKLNKNIKKRFSVQEIDCYKISNFSDAKRALRDYAMGDIICTDLSNNILLFKLVDYLMENKIPCISLNNRNQFQYFSYWN